MAACAQSLRCGSTLPGPVAPARIQQRASCAPLGHTVAARKSLSRHNSKSHSAYPALPLKTQRQSFACRASRADSQSASALADSVEERIHLSGAATNEAKEGREVNSELVGKNGETIEERDAAAPQLIWLSDVKAQKKRPYFLNRKWTGKDLAIAAYMTVLHGLALLAPFTFTWDRLALFGVLYVITGMLGITLSYHRNLSHKSFKLPKWLEYTFAYCGALAGQGPPMEWVSAHRIHHQHCDTPSDPHTPIEGFWHSHMGWVLDDEATSSKVSNRNNIADMVNDPFYNFLEKTYSWHLVGLGALLFAWGGLPYIIWGMALRAVWVYHITWAVNSAAHVWGYQSWNTGDLSRNNWWVGLLAFGEGWHNNHHAFEYSARHGLAWWEFDLTWYTVKALEALGLASKIKLPTKEHVARLTLKGNSAAAT